MLVLFLWLGWRDSTWPAKESYFCQGHPSGVGRPKSPGLCRSSPLRTHKQYKKHIPLAYAFYIGWDGGIRTPECRDQNPVPYHLATSQ